MAMTNEQLTKWIDEIFGTIDEIKQNSGDISGLTRSVRQLREDLTATQADVTDLEDQTAGVVALPKAALQHFTDGSATQALDLVADIIPVQAGTGDPSPTNVRAITGYSSVTANAAGKNMWDGTDSYTNGLLQEDGSIAEPFAHWKITRYINVKGGNEYTLSFSGSITLNNSYICFYDINFNFISSFNWTTTSVRTVLAPNNAAYMRASYYDSITDLQVEDGTEATTYEPYQANTATISLGSTVYGGTVNFTTGELVVDKAIVDLGTLNWFYKDVENPYFYSEATSDIPLGTDMLCSSYKVVDPSTFATGADLVIERAYRTNDGLNIRDTNYTDATLFKAALDGVKLVYPLTTPTTTTLTPAQLSLLQGENNVSATSGPITLTYAPDNVLAEVYAYIQKRFDTLTASLAANRTTRKTTKTLTKKED